MVNDNKYIEVKLDREIVILMRYLEECYKERVKLEKVMYFLKDVLGSATEDSLINRYKFVSAKVNVFSDFQSASYAGGLVFLKNDLYRLMNIPHLEEIKQKYIKLPEDKRGLVREYLESMLSKLDCIIDRSGRIASVMDKLCNIAVRIMCEYYLDGDKRELCREMNSDIVLNEIKKCSKDANEFMKYYMRDNINKTAKAWVMRTGIEVDVNKIDEQSERLQGRLECW